MDAHSPNGKISTWLAQLGDALTGKGLPADIIILVPSLESMIGRGADLIGQ